MENLLGDTPKGAGGGGGGGKEGKQKKKWRLRRKKKDKSKAAVKQQMSLPEEGTEDAAAKKQRSKSHDFDTLSERIEDGKLRSLTHDGRELSRVTDSSLRTVATKKKVRRSNTIIEKYRAIVDEQKKKEVPPIVKEKLESLPRFVDVRVWEMSPEEFRESLFCTQLEYKLRAALQNVHTPLGCGPQGWREEGEEETGPDLKWQLTTLLECALQCSQWVHDNMETALLSETLRMVAQLTDPQVAVVMESAHGEHTRREAYASYLVQSHMKFLDVRLQVGAVQTAVDRYQEVLKEQFVQFAVRQFLEGQARQVAELSRKMASLPLADECCSLMTERVESLTEGLLEDHTWKYWPADSVETVSWYLEDQLFSHLYTHVFQPNLELDRQRDEVYSAHLSRLSEGLTPTHRSLQISPIYHSGCPWLSAQKHLKAMSLYKSPRGKVHCIAESCRVLISLLQLAKVGSPPGADDLFPVLVYVLIRANPPGLLSTTQYIKNFLEEGLVGEENYWWVQFSTAVEFTKTLE
jgi:hypothetical protein